MDDEPENGITIGRTVGQECRVACASCQNVTKHRVVASSENHWWIDIADIGGVGRYQIVQCQGCEGLSFRLETVDSQGPVDDQGEVLPSVEVFPPRMPGRSMLADRYLLPLKIRSIYEQVYRALSLELTALAAVGMRTLVEQVCVEVGAKGWGFEEKVNKMVSLGRLTPQHATLLEPIRRIGNAAAHEALAPNVDELSPALDVVEHLLAGVYLLESRIGRLDKDRNFGSHSNESS